ncbi:MAG: hypothetical protein IJ796_03855 [Lachnospiraceae bacterium]|nr:hypothetical protein [Lachnospiraceae bacterium]
MIRFTGPLDDEGKNCIREICENAKAGNSYVYDIMDMISEELSPYFEGQRSAEKTAEILNSRVQLYLDENS